MERRERVHKLVQLKNANQRKHRIRLTSIYEYLILTRLFNLRCDFKENLFSYSKIQNACYSRLDKIFRMNNDSPSR